MKASELRIGNLISWISSGDLEKVIKIEFKYVNDVSESDLNPIELTPEYLLKFGFKKGCKYSNDGYTFPCGDFFFYDNLFDVLEGCGGRCISIVKSVHSLQNLYFALTGKELKLIEE